MSRPWAKLCLAASLLLNVLVAIPALVVLLTSVDVRFVVYHKLAARLGTPEIVFINDSITQQAGLWAFRLGYNNLNVWNYGKGGFTSGQLLPVAQRVGEMSGVRYAFIMAGINDTDKSTAGAGESFANIRATVEVLEQAGITPIIQSTLYRTNEVSPEFVGRLNFLLSEYASEAGHIWIDMNAHLAAAQSLLGQCTTDGIHLNERGCSRWGDVLSDLLSDLEAPSTLSTN